MHEVMQWVVRIIALLIGVLAWFSVGIVVVSIFENTIAPLMHKAFIMLSLIFWPIIFVVMVCIVIVNLSWKAGQKIGDIVERKYWRLMNKLEKE